LKTITTHYIDGAFVESHGREVMDIINPTNRERIAQVTLADEEDARRAIVAAKRAFAGFGRTTKEERMEILRRLHKAVSARTEDLTKMMVEEYGGVVQFAAPIVQAGAAVFLSAEKALHDLPLTRSWGKTTVTMEPVGVAGLISPWNADAFFLCMKLASAVAAGCTVVMKPSELSALQTSVWLECVYEANLPKGLCNVVSGRGEVVGAELVRNPDVAKISFTGSAAVGRSIMRDGAATMKRVTLELGGKSPNILLDDADLKKAIPDAFIIGFMNNGQACVAGTRLLVPKSRFDEVKRALVDTIPAFPVGDPADPKTAVGPMVTEKQYERVQSYIRKGIEEGAEVLVGGEGQSARPRIGLFRETHGICQRGERYDNRPGRDFRPRPLSHHLPGRRGCDQDRKRYRVRPPRLCERHRHSARTPRRISDPSRPSGNQWAARRSTGSVRRIQTFRLRPRIRNVRDRSVS